MSVICRDRYGMLPIKVGIINVFQFPATCTCVCAKSIRNKHLAPRRCYIWCSHPIFACATALKHRHSAVCWSICGSVSTSGHLQRATTDVNVCVCVYRPLYTPEVYPSTIYALHREWKGQSTYIFFTTHKTPAITHDESTSMGSVLCAHMHEVCALPSTTNIAIVYKHETTRRKPKTLNIRPRYPVFVVCTTRPFKRRVAGKLTPKAFCVGSPF